MKILFYQASDVIDSSGGTEKVMCNLASILASKKEYEVILMTNENKKGQPFFKLSKKVKFINIGGTNFKFIRKIIFKLIKSTKLIKIFSYFNNFKYTSDILYEKINNLKPDIIILANPSDLLQICYCHKYKIPIIQMIHGVPWNIFHRKSQTILKETLRVMENVSATQVLMKSYINLMKPFYNGKIVCIPNIVPTLTDNQLVKYKNKKKFTIIDIARVTSGKNQKLLIESFIKLSNKYQDWQIIFFGKESKKYTEQLKHIIQQNGLEKIIKFGGIIKNPIKQLQQADIFAFPSLFEGFPLSLAEAMAVGLPTIGLEEAPGVNELIVNNKNGLLAKNNIEDFSLKLEKLIENIKLREQYGKQAHKMMLNFNEENIINKWEQLLKEIYENFKYNSK